VAVTRVWTSLVDSANSSHIVDFNGSVYNGYFMGDFWVGNNLYNGKFRPLHTTLALFVLNFLSIHAHEKHTQIADHYRPKYIPMWVDDLMIKFDGVKL
jgi:hypothetical protein